MRTQLVLDPWQLLGSCRNSWIIVNISQVVVMFTLQAKGPGFNSQTGQLSPTKVLQCYPVSGWLLSEPKGKAITVLQCSSYVLSDGGPAPLAHVAYLSASTACISALAAHPLALSDGPQWHFENQDCQSAVTFCHFYEPAACYFNKLRIRLKCVFSFLLIALMIHQDFSLSGYFIRMFI